MGNDDIRPWLIEPGTVNVRPMSVDDVVIRRIGPGDVEAAAGVLQAAFGLPVDFRARLRLALALGPEGWLLAEERGEIVGTVGAVKYGPVAYVGMMSVAPSQQGRGLGRRLLVQLLAELEASGFREVWLDATPAGARLYERLGFVDAGSSSVLIAPQLATPTSNVADGSPIMVSSLADAPERLTAMVGQAAELDRVCFGADRTAFLAATLSAVPARTLVTTESDSAVTGYLVATDDAIGPWVARNQDVALALLRRAWALPFAAPPRLIVPCDNRVALDALTARGFRPVLTTRHMRLGGPPSGWTDVWAKASFTFG